MSAAARQEESQPIALVVFGRDEKGKPHASGFIATEVELATRAAAMMGMTVMRPETDEHVVLAARVPRGRVFGSGKAFVPFCNTGLYAALAAAAGQSGGTALASQAEGPSAGLQSPPEGGVGGEGAPTGGNDGQPTRAGDWGGIGVGSLVLATEGQGEGWFEAVAVSVQEPFLTLRWRDWPTQPVFARKRNQLGLLPDTPAA